MNDGPKNSRRRREVLAWCCYDWANSGYTTLMITVFAVYLQGTVFRKESWGDTGPIVWAWGVSISMLLGAVFSPVLGAVADAQGSKRRWLAITATGGSLACLAMAMLPPRHVWWVTGCFLVANLCLELSLTVYNGFLPEIADDTSMNRVSAAGMGWGYLGGGIALLIGILLVRYGERVGLLAMSDRLRWCIAGTGLWWGGFTVPTLWVLRDRRWASRPAVGMAKSARQTARDLLGTFLQMRNYPALVTFLIAFLFFNDGVQTVISQSSTFALHELHFTAGELLGVILMVQFLAMPGAIAIGRLADRWGQKRTLMACLFVWIGLLASAWVIESKPAYWVMAVGVSLVLGGTQAVGRAIVGVLTPEAHAAKFFGFYNLSGKATSFMGTFLFGAVIATTGSSRLAIIALLIFFVIGAVLMGRVDLAAGMRQRDVPKCDHRP